MIVRYNAGRARLPPARLSQFVDSWTAGLGRQLLVEPLEPGRCARREIAARCLPVVAIRRLGLGGQHSPEDDEGSEHQRELRRAEEQKPPQLLTPGEARAWE